MIHRNKVRGLMTSIFVATILITLSLPAFSPQDLSFNAHFTWDPEKPFDIETIQFIDNSSGNITAWQWDFGDNNTATNQTPSHKYKENGRYTVTLTITNDTNQTTSFSRKITVYNVPPISEFNYTPQQPYALHNISFIDTSVDRDGNIEHWHWNFGDGNASTEQHPTHSYAQKGTYTVTLTTIDNDNISNINLCSHTLTVLNNPPEANFTYHRINPNRYWEIQFNDTSYDIDGNITTWHWDFGDNTTSTSHDPKHSYADNGTYNVTLTVTDNDYANSTVSRNVTIANFPPRADFTFTPISSSHPEIICFNDTSYDLDGSIVNWTWDFGDATNYSYQQNTTHTYATAGEYLVTLTVVDDDADHDAAIKKIIINDTKPPQQVTGVNVTDKKNGKLKITWEKPSDPLGEIDHYKLNRNDNFLINISSVSYLDEGLQNGNTYTYTVSAVDTSGNEGNTSVPASGMPTARKSPSSGGGRYRPPSNHNPDVPPQPTGPSFGFINTNYSYTTSTSDPDNNDVYYQFDWGNNTHSEWIGPYDSGKTVEGTHRWTIAGTYNISVRAKDTREAKSSWSIPLQVTIMGANYPPSIPTLVNGSSFGECNVSYAFTISSVDPDNNSVQYEVDWGDNTSVLTNFSASGEKVSVFHNWTQEGTYEVSFRAIDEYDAMSAWSQPVLFTVDSTMPTITIIRPEEHVSISDTLRVVANVSDQQVADVCFELVRNNATVDSYHCAGFPYQWKRDIGSFDSGLFTVKVTAKDMAGNMNTDSLEVTFVSVDVLTMNLLVALFMGVVVGAFMLFIASRKRV